VVALIAPRDGAEPALQDLARHCESRVARYQLPRALVTVTEVVRHQAASRPHP
jgi:acyl-CoA synthetase (AMP-forming)/AMP-acid ligase II